MAFSQTTALRVGSWGVAPGYDECGLRPDVRCGAASVWPKTVFVLHRTSRQELRSVLECGSLTPLSFCVSFAFCTIAVGGAEKKERHICWSRASITCPKPPLSCKARPGPREYPLGQRTQRVSRRSTQAFEQYPHAVVQANRQALDDWLAQGGPASPRPLLLRPDAVFETVWIERQPEKPVRVRHDDGGLGQ